MKTVFITGGSSGVGRRTALTHADRGDITFASVRNATDATALEREAKSRGGNIIPVIMDVTDLASIDRAVSLIRNRTDCIDVVANIAGISGIASLEAGDDTFYQHMMDVNFYGPLRVARAFLPWMREQHGGTLLFMSSLAGRVPVPGESAYAASKHALEGAVESLVFEWARFGIRGALVESSYHNTPIAETVTKPVDLPQTPYHPLMQHLSDLASASIRAAPDPQPLADAFFGLSRMADPPIRTIVGDRGNAIAAARATTSYAEWHALTVERARMGWWTDTDFKSIPEPDTSR